MPEDPALILMRQRRAQREQQAAPAPEQSFMDSALDVVTTPGRALGRAIYGMTRTPQTEGYTTSQGVRIPAAREAVRAGLDTGQSPARRLGAAVGMLTSFDPAEQVAMLRAGSDKPIRVMGSKVVNGRSVSSWFPGEVPEGWTIGDGKGNVFVTDGGAPVLLNAPGFSVQDAAQIVGNAALYTPAGRAGGAGLRGVGRAAVAAGTTSAATETAQSAMGGSFDPTSVATNTVLGGGSQALVNGLTRLLPSLREMWRPGGMSDDAIDAIRRDAIAAGADPANLTDDVIIAAAQQAARDRPSLPSRLASTADQAGADAERATTAAVAGAAQREFPEIPLTRGDQTLNQNQLLDESMMRAGNYGPMARQIMMESDAAKSAGVRQAVDRVQEGLKQTPRGAPIASAQEGAATVAQAVRDAESAASTAVSTAYQSVGKGAVVPKGMERVARAVTARARSDRSFDPTLRETSKLLAAARQVSRLQSGKTGLGIRPTDINRVEQMRRRFRTAYDAAENNADRAQVRQLQEAFDAELDGVIADGLLSGDANALAAMKQARALMADYARRFFENGKTTRGGTTIGDPAGKLIQTVIAADPTAEQVTNMLFGARAISNRAGPQIAERLKVVLKDNPEGWDALRQTAFLRLVQQRVGNGSESYIDVLATQKAFLKVMDGPEAGMLRVLFTPEELGQMRRLFGQAARTRSQVIGSPPTGQRVLTAVWSRYASQLFGQGNIITSAVASIPNAARNPRGAIRAVGATRPFSGWQVNRPAAQALQPAGVALGQEATATEPPPPQ